MLVSSLRMGPEMLATNDTRVEVRNGLVLKGDVAVPPGRASHLELVLEEVERDFESFRAEGDE